jgi:hypothetical protein
MTAVPDIRRQCEYLANHLSVLAKAVRPRIDPFWPPEVSAASAGL